MGVRLMLSKDEYEKSPRQEGYPKLVKFTSELARKAGSKGGESRSPKKGLGIKLAYYKKNGLSDERLDDFLNNLYDAEVSSLDIYVYLQQLKSISVNNPEQMIKITRLIMDWHKMWHGDKGSSKTLILNNTEHQQVKIEIVRSEEKE